METSRCEFGTCKNNAKFYVHQATYPQRLATGEMETSPAGRSASTCGTHLSGTVALLSALHFKSADYVKVKVL